MLVLLLRLWLHTAPQHVPRHDVTAAVSSSRVLWQPIFRCTTATAWSVKPCSRINYGVDLDILIFINEIQTIKQKDQQFFFQLFEIFAFTNSKETWYLSIYSIFLFNLGIPKTFFPGSAFSLLYKFYRYVHWCIFIPSQLNPIQMNIHIKMYLMIQCRRHVLRTRIFC